ncbi:cysteine desulfurase family protein [Acuticoccus sp. MNP-M23]|uniref:cysteine desulfurase family protein n=1 Tax=Acuticoccus sp. MNP-M23 TaxID=3072793 RepID=UPI002814FD47|nr:cysteine desulfurase family protein [Acuticoccus sp. MNP-M23]WMS42314.1 cysteine desulfurase family protein [Acuticoccus sp. MNP-M23]
MPQHPDRLYLDWNATAPLNAAARSAAIDAMTAGGNASSVHAEGRAARALVETVRRQLGQRFGVSAEAVTFTSGGTEANAMALSPGAVCGAGGPAERLIVSAVEHPAVSAGGRFAPDAITVVPVDAEGVVDLDALLQALDGTPALVSIMAANNETGVLQPLGEIARLVRAAGGVFHTDAVQAFGRVADADLVADLVTVSGHKIGAPTGVGALVRRGMATVPALISGGGQERGARGGTENVAAIAGLGAALKSAAANADGWADTRFARDQFEAALAETFPKANIFAKGAPRLPNTSLFSPGEIPAEISLIGLDMAGVAVSSGAACSSGSVKPSHVLAAMGVPEAVARTALRVSAGPAGAEAAFQRFLLALRDVIVPMEGRSIARRGPTYGL